MKKEQPTANKQRLALMRKINMRKRNIFILIFVLSTAGGFAQNDSLRFNSFFIELGGVGGTFSLNYDRTFYFNNIFGIIAGIGFSPLLIDFEFTPRVPIQLKLFYQKRKNTIEMGTAFTPYLWYDNEEIFSKNIQEVQLAIFGQLGYKYSILKAKSFVGIAFTPLVYDAGDFYFLPSGTLRFGYKF